MKKKLLSLVIVLAMITALALPVLADNSYKAGSGNAIVYIKGKTTAAKAQDIVDHINQLRWNACKNGEPDPRDNGATNLDVNDYTEVSYAVWSETLQQLAQKRAAEITVNFSHNRPNGGTLDGLSTDTEAIAYSSTGLDLMDEGGAVDLWAEEREDWIAKSTTSKTNEYQLLINPDIKYVGMASLNPDGTKVRYSVAEFSKTEPAAAQAVSETEHTEPVEVPKRDIQSVALTPASVHLDVGGTTQLSMTAQVISETRYASVTQTCAMQPTSWVSSDTSAVSVDTTGTVKGLKNGKAKITATGDADLTATAEVYVGTSTAENDPFPVEHDVKTCASAAYTDVSKDASNWTHGFIDYVLEKKIMTGTSATTFEPGTNVSRAMVATILYAQAAKPAVTFQNTFSDVSSGAWYASPVVWAASKKLVSGYPDGTFKPNTDITRQDLALILYRYAEYSALDTSASGNLSRFSDASQVSGYAQTAVKWAVGHGLLSGFNDGTLRPTAATTRAQMAAIMTSYCEKVLK